MTLGAPRSFGAHLKALRETAGYTQEELAEISGLSVYAVSALERGERRRPHVETVRALSAALDLTGATREAFVRSARAPADPAAVDELGGLSQLPLPATSLLGREAEVRTLRDWFADAAVRLVTLTGPGGVGKTRLALEIAHGIAADGPGRVVFVPLAATRTPSLVASAVAEALGLAEITPLSLPKRLRVVCADRPTLLVLDNFEQVLEAAPLVADLLSSVASLRLLVTSRAALHVRGEREYVMGPLPLEADAEAPPADLARAPAVGLFMERVRDVQPDFQLTAANGPTVAAICRRLDGLPLALELAARWMKVLTPEDLLRRLGRDLLHSTTVARDLPARQQTMNATVAWSYQLLDADERRAFRRFGVLPGLFPIDAAASVLASRAHASPEVDALRAVAALIDKSLLVRADTSVLPTCPLYQMLETVRAYAALELDAAGERDDAMEGLVRYCLDEAVLAESGLVGLSQVQWLDRVREDLESYRAALGWLVERDRPAEAAGIAWRLMLFWLIRGYAAEGLRWYDAILGLPALPPAAESRALVGAALMWYAQGDLERARTAVTRARALADGADDRAIAAYAENTLGHVEHAVGNMEAARDCFARGHEGFQALGLQWGVGHALSGMAWVALATGDVAQAERLLDEATSELRHVGPWGLSLTRYLRATVAVRRENADDAIAWVRESLTHIRALHDRFALVYALLPLAAAAVLKRDHAWVARILGAWDAVTESTGATVVDASANVRRDDAEREARARLGPDRWALAYAAGRRISIDALLQDIDTIV